MSDELAHLRVAAQCLPTFERMALILYYHDRFTPREIAKLLNASRGRVEEALALARLKLGRVYAGSLSDGLREGGIAG